MESTMNHGRRHLFIGAAASLATALYSRLAIAQTAGPIRLGILIPLTGSTSQFGASMGKAAQLAADEINAGGGVRGRKIEILIEDDQSNPEAAVRAARKLIDVDKVIAICGTYASSVTSAVAPLCWDSKTVLLTASGADSITALPHQGYIFRTQPTTNLQGSRVAQFALELGAKSVFFLGPQTPFAQSYLDVITATVTKAGGTAGGVIYEDKKASYRSEVDRALKNSPDTIILGGYVPDTAVVMRDLFRAGYDKRRIGFSFGVNQKLVESAPAELLEGAYTLVGSAAVSSQSYKRLASKLKTEAVDAYTCQVYDHIQLVALALGVDPRSAMNGLAIRDNLRAISQDPQGKPVDSAADGLKLLASGAKVNFDGSSGPCEFADNGDVRGVFFRYEQIKAGKLVLTKIS
jgi:branched-chain amino acid transport system substrate-binding protein